MSSLLQPDDRITSSENLAAAPRYRRSGHLPVAATYGSEDLPVLIRLPDISLTESPVQTQPESSDVPSSDAEVSSGESISTASATSAPNTLGMPDQQPAEDRSDSTSARPRRERRGGRSRRQSDSANGSSWMRGVGQVVLAAVLAGVLFAIIVTIRGRPPNDDRAASLKRASEATAISQPGDSQALDPVPLMISSQQEIASPAEPETGPALPTLAPPSTSSDNVSAHTPAARVNAPRARRLLPPDNGAVTEPTSVQASPYPSTGVAPLSAARVSPRLEFDNRWREPVPSGRVRQANRPPTDYRYQPSAGSPANGLNHERSGSSLY